MRRIVIALVLTAAFGTGVLAGFSNREARAATRCYTTACQGGEQLYCCRTNGKLICLIKFCD